MREDRFKQAEDRQLQHDVHLLERQPFIKTRRRLFGKSNVLKGLATLLLVAAMSAKPAFADTQAVESRIVHFEQWMQQNQQKIESGEITPQQVAKAFNEVTFDLEEQVMKDVKSGHLDEALKHLGGIKTAAIKARNEQKVNDCNRLAKFILHLKNIVEKQPGSYTDGHKIYVVMSIATDNKDQAQSQALKQAPHELNHFLQGHGDNAEHQYHGAAVHGSATNNGRTIVVVTFDLVDDAHTTTQIMQHLPKASFN